MYLSFKTSGLVLRLTMPHIRYILKSFFQTVKQQGSESNCLYVFGADIKNMSNSISTPPHYFMTCTGKYLPYLKFITLGNQ